MTLSPPLGLLAEITHRCPLQCPYCSNPVELIARGGELATATWLDIIDQAAALGILQIHFSGGEPMARGDLAELIARAETRGLYANLITSGVQLNAETLAPLVAAGLPHVQLSFQDIEAAAADTMSGYRGSLGKKLAAARHVVAAGLSLTANFVIQRENCARVPDMIALGLALGAHRIEIAHVQYHGWSLLNRARLLPTRAQLDAVTEAVDRARAAHAGRIVIDYVIPDYYAEYPKACMAGWGRRFINIGPSGNVLPCHAAETITTVPIPNIATASLAGIWADSALFNLYRGTGWMAEPCRGCDRRELDWGGCRCQALALTGDAAATDPVCSRSVDRPKIDAALADAAGSGPDLVYRRYGNAS
jgi:pyrroloquinoline quinone biosynthesis protein E